MKEEWRLEMQQKMEGYRKPAPELSWSEIYRVMPAPHIVLPLWIKHTVAASVVLLIAGIGYRFLNVNDAVPMPDLPIETIKIDELQQMEQERPIIEKENPVSAQLEKVRRNQRLVSLETKTDVAPEYPADLIDSENTSVSQSVASESVEQAPATDDQQPSVVRKTEPVYPNLDLPQRKRKKESRLMAMAYVSNYMSDSYRSESHTQTGITQDISSRIVYQDPSTGRVCDLLDVDWEGEMIPITVYDTVTTKTNTLIDHEYSHHQPIRFGLMFLYRLNDHWSLESGLSYTRLLSDITTRVDGQVTAVSEQRLHYIGIPLNLGYQFRIYRRVGMYVKAGGSIEKMLNASPWQFSLNSAAGVNYELTDRFSLYFEPGVGYYFNDGSSISTLYKDHPLNYNLSIGLRISL